MQLLRRSILVGMATAANTIISQPGVSLMHQFYPELASSSIAHAEDGDIRNINPPPQFGAAKSTNTIDTLKKPFAPNEALQPAARVKLSIDRAISLTNQLVNDKEGSTSTVLSPAFIELERLIIQPQNYVGSFKTQGVPEKPSSLYLKAYQPMAGDLPLQVNLIKNGDVSAWKDLKRIEKEKEKDNEIRRSFNCYTDYLSFSGENYSLNVDRSTRSSMIRNDQLPDVRQVITSDMGMRYLYRNQILTAMDDVRAELEYQIKNTESSSSSSGNIDAEELLNLLKEAQRACNRWFDLIDPNDVKVAIESVSTIATTSVSSSAN